MTKDQAKVALGMLSSGTWASLTGLRTYAEIDADLLYALRQIDAADESMLAACQTWVDVWKVIRPAGQYS